MFPYITTQLLNSYAAARLLVYYKASILAYSFPNATDYIYSNNSVLAAD